MRLRAAGKLLVYGFAGILAVLLLLLLAAKLVLDRAPRYQAQIEKWVHGRIGYHIAFSHVSPALRWDGPELSFDRLELRSKDGLRVLARAANARVEFDVWGLFRSGKLLAGRIELDAPVLSITRTDSGGFALASEVELGGGSQRWWTLRLRDLPAGTLGIRGGTISLEHWNSALPHLQLREVTLQLQNSNSVATLALAARLPDELGGAVTLNAGTRGAGPLTTVGWTALGRTRDLSLDGWHRFFPQYLPRLDGGFGGFEAAVRGTGPTLVRADLDFHAMNVTTKLVDEPDVKFDRVSGALTVVHAADRWTMLGRHVLAQRGGRSDPASQFDVSWRASTAGLMELQFRASYLRAETLLPLAGFLPQADLRERLQEWAPSGEWFNTRVNLERSGIAQPWAIDVRARFKSMGFAPVGRAPGLRGLDGTIVGTQDGGRLDIDTQSAALAWPLQLPQSVDLDRLKTTVYWRRTSDEFLLASPAFDIKNRDAAIHALIAWRIPSGSGAPLMTLAASLDDGNVANAHRYLPRALLSPSVFAWLNRGFVSGHVAHADAVIQGPIRQFPFRDNSGFFLARAQVNDMTLDYRENWPRAEKLGLTAEFRNAGLSISLQNGNLGGLRVEKGEARFVDFKTAELKIHASASGDAADALAYLRATPLDAMSDQTFSSVEGRGQVACEVDLFLPFKSLDKRRVAVQLQLRDVALNRSGSPLMATDLNGYADIDGAQVARADVRGKVLGGIFQMQARAPRDRPVSRSLLVFNGTLAGEALQSALSLPPGMTLAGTADWHGVLRIAPEPARERSLRITTNLVGLELGVPLPLAKPRNAALPTSLDVQWPAAGARQLRVTLGSVLRAQVALQPVAGGLELSRAALIFGAGADPAVSDSQLVTVGGEIDKLDLAGWLRLYTPDRNSKPLSPYFRTARLEVAQLDYLGLSFRNLSLEFALTDVGWRIAIGGPNAAGTIDVPSAWDSAEPVKLEFERLNVGSAGEVEQSVAAAEGGGSRVANPRAVPAVQFHAADLTWGARQFGEVDANIVRLNDGIGLQKLRVIGESYSLSAHGEWRGKDQGAGRVEGSLNSDDVGATLKQLDYAAVIEAKSGKMDFDLSWLGAPTEEALSAAIGHFKATLEKGQITGLKPGAGRVVGLASIAALPRRLALDFSDLTDKGFAFDTVRGDFDLRDGSAYTDDVLVKGPAAEIGLIGRVGLKNRDYDQTAVVTGNVSSTLPLAAFAAGPVIGGAVLLFTQVFKQPLKGLARGYYRITGSWDNPIVERIKGAEGAASAEATK